MRSPRATVESFRDATNTGDWAAARALLSDHLSFHGPIDTFDRPDPYLSALQRLSPMVQKVDVLRTFAEGNEVVQLCHLHFPPPIGKMFVAEWYTVEGEKIASVQVVFDARPMASLPHP